LIFTPTGQRLRNPQFGSNLVKMLFTPNDEITQSEIKEEINTSIKKFIPIVDIKNIDGEVDESGRGYKIHIDYGVNEGNFEVNDSIDINI
jgi:phage baseplate assembly protein W